MKHRKRQKTALSLKIHILIRCILIAAVLLFVSCDSMKKHYKKGNRYLEEGRYDEAVRELSEAVEKCQEKDDEPCDLYLGRLEYAKSRAAEHHYALSQRRFAEKNLDQALKAIDQAIHYVPPEPLPELSPGDPRRYRGFGTITTTSIESGREGSMGCRN